MDEIRMFTPGPAHVPLAVKLASIASNNHHRSPDFRSLYSRIQCGLRYAFQTEKEVLLLPASGTGAMEAVVMNLVLPGDPVLILSAGKYGRRWKDLCATYKAQIRTYDVVDGMTFSLQDVEKELDLFSPRYIFVTHCETSTGALHDVASIAVLAKRYGARIIVDSMTTIGVEPFQMDAWGVDVALGSSHKGFMSPPGVAFITLSDAAWEGVRLGNDYSYWSFHMLRKNARNGTTPNTPPFSILLAVERALEFITSEKLENIWLRHQLCADVCRAGIVALGLALFPHSSQAAALTVAKLPSPISAGRVVEEIKQQYHILIASGQGDLADQIIRIGHIGSVSPLDMVGVLSALELVLTSHGMRTQPGKASEAAVQCLARHRHAHRTGISNDQNEQIRAATRRAV